jgi:hypothetical protein
MMAAKIAACVGGQLAIAAAGILIGIVLVAIIA